MTDARSFVVVGAGQAGGWCARTLRDRGFEGRVVLVGDEDYAPYERPPLSKEALTGEAGLESAYLWPPASWQELNVELKLGCRADAIDPEAHTVSLAGGEVLRYDRLMLATGSRPRQLDAPGADLPGIHLIRTMHDASAIRAEVKPGETAVVIGGGWIGLEAAAALTKLGMTVVVAEAASRLCGRAVTPAISDWLLDFHRGKGVDVRLNCSAARFEGGDVLERVVLGDGSVVDARLCIVGIGILPNVELAEAAGIRVDNGIVVDELCHTSAADVFACGEVTKHPNALLGRQVRLESWENAQNQGICGAKAMLGTAEPYNEVPWFWSDQFDANLQLVGLPLDWDEEATRGDPAEGAFITFYLKDGRIEGAVAVNQGRDLRFARRLMQAGVTVTAAELKDPSVKLQALLKR
jgi:3-phenylpropionate/trans-cinnamate dioxygenase ferredoxin reductase component